MPWWAWVLIIGVIGGVVYFVTKKFLNKTTNTRSSKVNVTEDENVTGHNKRDNKKVSNTDNQVNETSSGSRNVNENVERDDSVNNKEENNVDESKVENTNNQNNTTNVTGDEAKAAAAQAMAASLR